jgi:hypothetical protein
LEELRKPLKSGFRRLLRRRNCSQKEVRNANVHLAPSSVCSSSSIYGLRSCAPPSIALRLIQLSALLSASPLARTRWKPNVTMHIR